LRYLSYAATLRFAHTSFIYVANNKVLTHILPGFQPTQLRFVGRQLGWTVSHLSGASHGAIGILYTLIATREHTNLIAKGAQPAPH